MNELNGRRSSLESSKVKNRASESSFRIHLQSTKAVCRNKSITTTDSLKLYEDQIILKNPILDDINESSLQKRPLSLCFDLGSSGEDINTTDTSSTMSSVSSSSSSTNSKSYNSYSNESDSFMDDENYKCNKVTPLIEEYSIDCDLYCASIESSAKESIVTVINNRNSKSSESSDDPSQVFFPDDNHNPRDKILSFEQPYDLSSSDNIDVLKMHILDNDIALKRQSDLDAPPKYVRDIIELFNLNSLGMRMFEDEINGSLICSLKIFVNLCEPVRLQLPNTIGPPCKTLFPRGGFELINIERTSTCKDIIENLFDKFHIQENFNNYGLFEHVIQDDQKVLVKRLPYDFSILTYLIDMVRSEDSNFPIFIHSKRFVLQENEKVQINWSKFSQSELWNFLRILEKEEKERKQKIIKFYTELESMIKNQMNLTHD